MSCGYSGSGVVSGKYASIPLFVIDSDLDPFLQQRGCARYIDEHYVFEFLHL